jgi:hypothetical protein
VPHTTRFSLCGNWRIESSISNLQSSIWNRLDLAWVAHKSGPLATRDSNENYPITRLPNYPIPARCPTQRACREVSLPLKSACHAERSRRSEPARSSGGVEAPLATQSLSRTRKAFLPRSQIPNLPIIRLPNHPIPTTHYQNPVSRVPPRHWLPHSARLSRGGHFETLKL